MGFSILKVVLHSSMHKTHWKRQLRRLSKKKVICLLHIWNRSFLLIRPSDSLENLTITSPSTLAPVSTSLMSFDGTVASTYQQVHVNRRSASCGDESGKNSRLQCEEGRRTQQSQSTAKGAPRQGANVSPSSQVIKSVFVQGVGWASEVRSATSAYCICCKFLSLGIYFA